MDQDCISCRPPPLDFTVKRRTADAARGAATSGGGWLSPNDGTAHDLESHQAHARIAATRKLVVGIFQGFDH